MKKSTPSAPVQVKVRFSLDTYVARGGGKTASCTAGDAQAVQALARKLGLGNNAKLSQTQHLGGSLTVWEIEARA